uniref:Cytochrome P450 n=1 Tax=Varanus komodoensis TaxID=61221 RepID=A0A8D2J233_VARKO
MEPVAETTLNSSWSWLPQDISQIFYIVVILSFLYVVLKGIQLYWWNRYLVKGLSCFPGPPTHWLYGHIKMVNSVVQHGSLLKLISPQMTKTYPYCYPIWYGRFLAFLSINHPEYAKAVFSRNGKKCLTYGLLILNGPKWQQHRRLLTPGFHFDVLKPYVTLMADSVKEMLDVLEKLIPKHTTVSLEMFEHVTLMTFDTIMKCAFSYQGNCQTDRNNAYINTVFDISCMIMQRLKTPLYHSDLIYWFSSQGFRFRKACKLAHQHTDNVIRERKKYLKNEKEFEKILKKRRLDFLDILLCRSVITGRVQCVPRPFVVAHP